MKPSTKKFIETVNELDAAKPKRKYKEKKRFEPIPYRRGRPPKYEARFCEWLVEHMGSGLSFESFGAQVAVARETLYEWVEAHEDFAYAKRQGKELCIQWWEAKARDHITHYSKGKQLNSAVWIYNMKCRFREDWHDSVKVEHGGDLKNTITLAYSPKDEKKKP